MVDPIEDKSALEDRLRDDRQKMAVQVGELKEKYNALHLLRSSVQKNPWPSMIAAILTGFLISRVPSRKKTIYVLADSPQRKSLEEVQPARPKQADRKIVDKLWSLTKPIICTYIGGEIYQRFGRMARYASSRSR
jgi:hypothetical protein